ncbi:MAG: agmatinase [Myxococcota bacterium]|nr:agmatinase [Myxococcota bacterium]
MKTLEPGQTPPFDNHGPRYLDASEVLLEGRPALFGFPYDGTTSFRPGTRGGPDALRAASVGLETYSPTQDRDFEQRPFADLGNIDIPFGSPAPVVALAEQTTAWILEAGSVPFMIGGEHSLTVGPVRAVVAKHPDLAVIQIDAHADLRDGYLGEPLSHAAAMRRCLELLDGPDAMLQVGIRSGTREEFVEMREQGRLVSPDAASLRQALPRLGDRPLYITLDLDVFDPSCFPGTGTPEPGGIDWKTFAEILSVIPWDRVVGLDAVELSPMLDASGCSNVLAAKAVREMLLSL